MKVQELDNEQDGFSKVSLPDESILLGQDAPVWSIHTSRSVLAFTYETYIEETARVTVIAQHFESDGKDGVASAKLYRIQSIVPGSGHLTQYDRPDWSGVQSVCENIKDEYLRANEDDYAYAFGAEIQERIPIVTTVSLEQLDVLRQNGITFHIPIGIAHVDNELPEFVRAALLELAKEEEKEQISDIYCDLYSDAVMEWPVEVRLRMIPFLCDLSYYADGDSPDIDMSKHAARHFLAKFPQVRTMFDHEPEIVATWFR